MRIGRHLSSGSTRLVRRLARPLLRHCQAELATDFSQTEALIALYATLAIRRPLPPLRRSSIGPDVACQLVGLILDEKPATVLELGSGASTVIIGYALQREGHGRIVSLEHDQGWFERSTALVRAHGLEGNAKVVYSPLRSHAIAGEEWPWYDLSALADCAVIDLLVVDGPPGSLRTYARYPALPLLRDRLSPTAVLVVDDADRPHEAAIVKRWVSDIGEFRAEYVRTERGLCILRRDGAGRRQQTATT